MYVRVCVKQNYVKTIAIWQLPFAIRSNMVGCETL